MIVKGLIFGVKPYIPALWRPGNGLVVAPSKKASLHRALSSTVCSVVSSLSLLPQYIGAILWSSEPCLPASTVLLELDAYGTVDPLGAYHPFLKMIADIFPLKLSIIFLWIIRLGPIPECWRSVIIIAECENCICHSVVSGVAEQAVKSVRTNVLLAHPPFWIMQRGCSSRGSQLQDTSSSSSLIDLCVLDHYIFFDLNQT